MNEEGSHQLASLISKGSSAYRKKTPAVIAKVGGDSGFIDMDNDSAVDHPWTFEMEMNEIEWNYYYYLFKYK